MVPQSETVKLGCWSQNPCKISPPSSESGKSNRAYADCALVKRGSNWTHMLPELPTWKHLTLQSTYLSFPVVRNRIGKRVWRVGAASFRHRHNFASTSLATFLFQKINV
jgi:hypothetical protein